MISKNTQKGNLLTASLGLLVCIIILCFIYFLASNGSSTISYKLSNNLNEMQKDVVNTPFEKKFNEEVNKALKDGRVTVSEYTELEEMYQGYLTASLAKSGQEYIDKVGSVEKQVKQPVVQTKEQKEASRLTDILTLAAMSIIALIVVFACYKRAH